MTDNAVPKKKLENININTENSQDAIDRKANAVHAMFETIAGRYDYLNDVLSLGIHRTWRQEVVEEISNIVKTRSSTLLQILDVATGTADMAIALKRSFPEADIVGVDFSETMLALGRKKADKFGLELNLEQGDGLALPYPDNYADVITITYGLRNFADYQKGIEEMARVLRPNGTLIVLDFPPPKTNVLNRLFRVYLLRIVPLIAALLTGQASAYHYLGKSTLNFPAPEKLAEMLEKAGFSSIRYRLQTFGVSVMHVAILESSSS